MEIAKKNPVTPEMVAELIEKIDKLGVAECTN